MAIRGEAATRAWIKKLKLYDPSRFQELKAKLQDGVTWCDLREACKMARDKPVAPEQAAQEEPPALQEPLGDQEEPSADQSTLIQEKLIRRLEDEDRLHKTRTIAPSDGALDEIEEALGLCPKPLAIVPPPSNPVPPIETYRVAPLVGLGGCVAEGLSALGVFLTRAEAIAALDANIEPELERLRGLNTKMIGYPREEVGIDGTIWSTSVIQRTVIQAGFDFRKIKRGDWYTAINSRHGVLIDGTLNSSFMNKLRRSTKRVHLYSKTELIESSPMSRPQEWRHAIAVTRGRLFDTPHLTRVRLESVPCASLWMNRAGEVDPKRGYMRNVLRAFMITRHQEL